MIEFRTDIELVERERHRRPFWWIWAAFILVGVTLEAIAIFTEEKDLPTLSRFTWMLVDYWPWLAAVIVIGLGWAIIHLAGGECALGVC